MDDDDMDAGIPVCFAVPPEVVVVVQAVPVPPEAVILE
jgi:hypothetical protein